MSIMRWNAADRGTMSVETIKASLDHPERCRVTVNRYSPGTAFSGHTRAGTVYLLSGSCRYSHANGVDTLTANDIFALPAGKYRLEVVGDSEVEEVKVWLLPEAAWRS